MTTAPARPSTDHSARNTTDIPVLRIPVDAITPSPLNPRRRFDEEALAELAQSITDHGLLEPIVVRPSEVDAETYLLVAGERRWRATKLAGQETIVARLLPPMDDRTALELALVENLQRQDLDPIEEAEGYRELNRIVGLKQVEIAAAVNRSQPAIANAMRLLELPETVQEHVQGKRLTRAHGIALAKYAKWPKLCTAIADYALETGSTSKELERGVTVGFEHSGIDADDLPKDAIRRIESDVETKQLVDAGLTVWGPEHGYYRYTPDVGRYDAVMADIARAERARIQRELQEARDAAKAEGVQLISLDSLSYGSYERVGRPAPDGCTKDCPCRAKALEHGGKEVVQICTDPKRYTKLKTARAREEGKERRKEAGEKAAELDAILAAAPALDVRGLAIVVADRLWQFPKAVGRRLIEQFAAGALDPKLLDSFNGRRDTYEKLAQLEVENLVRILVHGCLLDDVTRYRQYGTMQPRLTWYMENAGVDLLPSDVGELKRRIQEARAKSRDPDIINQPGLYDRWRATLTQLEERLAEAKRAPKPRTNPTVCQGCGHVRGKCTCEGPGTNEPSDQPTTAGQIEGARVTLLTLCRQYGILEEWEQIGDIALLEFAADLEVREDVPAQTKLAVRTSIDVLRAAGEGVA